MLGLGCFLRVFGFVLVVDLLIAWFGVCLLLVFGWVHFRVMCLQFCGCVLSIVLDC